ncbi:MAG: PrgI family protein, partial [Longispora sp.]|nr:PrgI family protein [Longispora sp. (in: high G+C Gram-positive bacteria)]
MSDARSFGGWQDERSGFIGGLSVGGFTLIAAAVLVVMVPLYRGAIVEELIAVPIAGLLVAAAMVRISGLTVFEWAHLGSRNTLGSVFGQQVFASGAFAPARVDDPAGDQPVDLPGTLARLRFLNALSGYGGKYGVVYDPIDNTYAIVCRVRYPGLALADTETQTARVASWGGLLQSLCVEGGVWVRVAVQQRCDRDDGTALRAWATERIDPNAPAEATADLQALMANTGP